MSGKLFNSIASWAIKKRIHQIELFMKHPNEVQHELLMELISTARQTEWGKKFGYSSISSVKEFQNQVPLSGYEEVFPWIDKMLKGEKNILWPGKMKWFSKSSGTTNDKSKFIPVSKEALEGCHYKGGKDLVCLYLSNNPESNLFSGKSLVLGGSHYKVDNSNNVFVGDVSAVIMQNLPLWAEWVRTPDLETALLADYQQKIQRIIEKSIDKNVTNLAGVPTWTVVLIQKILKQTGKQHLLEIWPNLEAFFHGGVNFEPYRDLFNSLIPSTQMKYINSYNASEGFFGIQDSNKAEDMLLMLDYGIFYEFIETGTDHSEPIILGQVELHKNYEVLITTNAGLARYRLGDTIQFTSLTPHRFRITGRTKHFINAFGEELIIDNADQAIQEACLRTGAKLNNYSAAPIYLGENGSRGGHEWLVEFEQEPRDIEDFVVILDDYLKKINSDYEAKRAGDLAMVKPLVRVLPVGTFHIWMESRGKLGGQNKVPRLANHRRFVDSILEKTSVR